MTSFSCSSRWRFVLEKLVCSAYLHIISEAEINAEKWTRERHMSCTCLSTINRWYVVESLESEQVCYSNSWFHYACVKKTLRLRIRKEIVFWNRSTWLQLINQSASTFGFKSMGRHKSHVNVTCNTKALLFICTTVIYYYHVRER